MPCCKIIITHSTELLHIQQQLVKDLNVIDVRVLFRIGHYYSNIRTRSMEVPFVVGIVPVLFRIGMTFFITGTPSMEEQMGFHCKTPHGN